MNVSIKTLSGMTPGIRGGRANLETIRNARALSAEAVSHIMGYISTQNAAAQVWACGVGRGGGSSPCARMRRPIALCSPR